MITAEQAHPHGPSAWAWVNTCIPLSNTGSSAPRRVYQAFRVAQVFRITLRLEREQAKQAKLKAELEVSASRRSRRPV